MGDNIAYQNKDITSKAFAERFKGKSLKVYGLDIPTIKRVLPTNIPQIQANELKIDNVFLLVDDTIAIIDYESTYDEKNKHKYILRICQNLIHKRFLIDWHIKLKIISMIESGTITEEKAAETLKCSLDEFHRMKDSLMKLS